MSDGVKVRGVLLYRPPHLLTDEEFDQMRAAEARGDPKLDPIEVAMSGMTEAEHAALIERLRPLPRRVLPAILPEVPPWLVEAADHDPVRLFENGFDSLQEAGSLRCRARVKSERQRGKRFKVAEVAQALSEAGGLKLNAVLQNLLDAFNAGELAFYSSESPLRPMDPAKEAARGGAMHTLFYEGWTTPREVDEWLDQVDKERLLPRFPRGPWSAGPIALPQEERNDQPTAAAGRQPGPSAAKDSPAPVPHGKPAKQDSIRKDVVLNALRVKFGPDLSSLPTYFDGDHSGDPVRNAAEAALPGVSESTVRKLLSDLRSSGEIDPRDRKVKKPRREAQPRAR